MWFPPPTDATYDFVPIDPAAITVGTRLFSVEEVTGTITNITPGDPVTLWSYDLDVTAPDGSTVFDVAFMPDNPAGQAPEWWNRFRMVRRIDKVPPLWLTSATDGSAWIYPGTDGRVTCYRPADTSPVWPRGASVYIGEWTLDPNDIYTAGDVAYDWLPVNNPSDPVVGDVVTWSKTYAVDVDEVTVDATNPAFTRTTFLNSSVPVGWWDQLDPGAVGGGYRWGFMERIPNPDPDTLWQSPDGAKWIYAADSLFYCFIGGGVYHRGETLRRAQVDGGLTEWTQ